MFLTRSLRRGRLLNRFTASTDSPSPHNFPSHQLRSTPLANHSGVHTSVTSRNYTTAKKPTSTTTTDEAPPADDAPNTAADPFIEIIDTSLFPESMFGGGDDMSGGIPVGGIPSSVAKELRHLKNAKVSSWVVRNVTQEIKHRLENHIDSNHTEEALTDGIVVLAGPREMGKSVVLCQVVQWARANGWIVLYSPDSGSLLRTGVQIYPSRHTEGLFDQPDVALPMLMNIRTAHGKQLNRLHIKGETQNDEAYVEERQRKADKSGNANASLQCTLLDICDQGLLNGADASTAYRDLRTQLSLVEKEDEAKVLFVIDDVNTLYSDTVFGYGADPDLGGLDAQTVHAHDLTLSSCLQPFNKEGVVPNFVPKHGAVVAATTGQAHYLPSHKEIRKKVPSLFNYLVPVTPYEPEEFDAAIRMFSHSGVLPPNVLRPLGAEEKRGNRILAELATAKTETSCHPGVLYEHIAISSIGGEVFSGEEHFDTYKFRNASGNKSAM